MRLRLTRLGYAVLGVLVLLYLAAWTSQSGLLLFLSGILLGCLVVNAVASIATLRKVSLQAPVRTRTEEGATPPIPWHVANATGGTSGVAELWLGTTHLAILPPIPKRTSVDLTLDPSVLRRGVHSLSDLVLASGHPFGLVRAHGARPTSGELVVQPKTFRGVSPAALGFEPVVGGKQAGASHSTLGSQFAGVRPLQPGDPLKLVHWPSSAKGLGLMSKVFDEELSGRVAVLIVVGADPDRLDDAVRAAASLVLAGLEAGHRVDWICAHEAHPIALSPFADQAEVLDQLAAIPAPADHPTPAELETAASALPVKAMLHLVAAEATPELAGVLRRMAEQNRAFRLYLPAHAAADSLPFPATRYARDRWIEAS
jgi:uncharacterized protein (DUF58 family)